jgi:methylmalonyl-CoA mutase, N-terminal domain
VVGVNRFVDETAKPVELQRISEEETAGQIERLRALRASRGQAAVDAALLRVEETARGTGNMLEPMREALAARATLGEVSDALRHVFGEYRATV